MVYFLGDGGEGGGGICSVCSNIPIISNHSAAVTSELSSDERILILVFVECQRPEERDGGTEATSSRGG
jgi:hypothetical protein